MDFDPQKFFIGLMDFFSVLLPGALLTFLVQDDLGPKLLDGRFCQLAGPGPAGWIAFLVSSYLLGHFIFLIGSWALDDHLYDPLRNATYAQQVSRLASGKRLSHRWMRRAAPRFFKPAADTTLRRAIVMRNRYLDPVGASSAVNAFQWGKARLLVESPAGAAVVQRFEADSKFFRSLVVVLAFLTIWGAWYGRISLAVVSAGLIAPALWRYIDQRAKAINQTHWLIFTLEGAKAAAAPTLISPARPSRAGGVVYRTSRSSTEYLLVQASKAPSEWVLPKGHVEADETPAEAAVREVREEAGVWATVEEELKSVTYSLEGRPLTVRFFLMRRLEEGGRHEKRAHQWLPLNAAVAKATHSETKELLQRADTARRDRENDLGMMDAN